MNCRIQLKRMQLLAGVQGNAVHPIQILMDVCNVFALQITRQYCADGFTRREVHMFGNPIDGKAVGFLNVRIDNGFDESARNACT